MSANATLGEFAMNSVFNEGQWSIATSYGKKTRRKGRISADRCWAQTKRLVTVYSPTSVVFRVSIFFRLCEGKMTIVFLLVEGNVRRCFTQDDDQARRLRSRPKHPAKIHIWGGISARGTTDLVIFSGNQRLDSKMYCQILERSYLRFANKRYHGMLFYSCSNASLLPEHACVIGFAKLVHDNAPAHKSSFTAQWMQANGVSTLEWPPESPDLNPIELVRGNMKEHFFVWFTYTYLPTYVHSFRKQKVTTIEDLKKAAKDYWRGLTPEMCWRYICGMLWRMEKILEASEGNIVERKP